MPSNDNTRPDDDQNTKPMGNELTIDRLSATPQSPSFFDNTSLSETAFDSSLSSQLFDAESFPLEFGNYTLLELVGEGGAGVVFKAQPISNHVAASPFDLVAIKLIRPEIMANAKAAQRFEKEARLHAEVESSYVTRHLEYGCEKGMYYIASEFVSGVGLDQLIGQFCSQPAIQSLKVITDVLKALAGLHDAGVIHRDVKPGNVIVNFGDTNTSAEDISFDKFEIAKLTDFGLARHIEQSESLAMTRQRAILGTPYYMAPEQYYESRSVDARADIYSVGVTLYQMLTGKLPFESDEPIELAEMHRVERPRPLTLVRQGTSEAVNNVVMKALEKSPPLRYQNASEMLADVQRIINGQPTSLRLYPETPDSFHRSVRSYDFEWTLASTPKKLWPLVSDTDRFNQAIGLPAPEFSYDHSGDARKVYAKANFNGMNVRWLEHPFQWIFEREMSVLREFDAGPFEWVTSTVELHPLSGGRTRLLHRFQVKPRGWFGKLLTPVQFSIMTKRSLNRVYMNLEKIANDTSCGYACDVSFSKPASLSSKQRLALNERIEKLARSISNRALAKDFGRLLESVADPIAARLRPVPLSQKLNCNRDQSLALCINGVEVGLLNMSWDVICPVCRIAAKNTNSLENIQNHGHCEVCNLDFEVDFAKSVEAIFSIHPEIRPIELKTYCIGGPFHAPHVLAQNRLLPGQHVDVGTEFAPGKYEFRGPQLGSFPDIDVHANAMANRAELSIGDGAEAPLPDLRSGTACVQIKNRSSEEVLVRLEQVPDPDMAVTAAEIGQHALFQKTFPLEIVAPADLVDLSNVYLLAIKLIAAETLIDEVGDVQVREYWTQLQNCLLRGSGHCEVIECTHEIMLVSFDKFEGLMRSLSSILTQDSAQGIPMGECCFSINSGEVMLGMQSNQSNAFGKTIRETRKWLSDLDNGCLAISNPLFELADGNDSGSLTWFVKEFEIVESSTSPNFVRLVRRHS